MVKRIPVYVVLPPRSMMLDVAGPLDVLRRANQEQSEVMFDVVCVAAGSRIVTSVGLVFADLQPLPAEMPSGSLIVVVGNVEEVMSCTGPARHPILTREDARAEAAIVDWLRTAIRPSHKLATICSGSFLVARAGLFDGHQCTTHYSDLAQLAVLAPAARVLENRLYVQDGNLYSCAGVTSGIDLMLYLLQEWVGREVILSIARYLVIYLRRSGTDPQLSPWLEGRNHIHPAVHRVQDAIAADPTRAWNRAQLAKIAGASGRHLSRLFRDHVGMPVVDYRNRLRVAIAKELISNSQMDMERVAEQSGFESTRQLRRAWGRIYKTSPRNTRRPLSKLPCANVEQPC